jgi:methyltransferase
VVVEFLTAAPAPAWTLAAVLLAERGLELALSRRHLRRIRGTSASGNLEWSAMIAVHAALLVLPAAEAVYLGSRAPLAALWAAIGVATAAQGLRYWSILSLGPAWNARARVDPELGFVERGPYRWIRHPNYLAVLLEFAAVPIAFGAWRSWILLNLLHLPLMLRRIVQEERLLRAIPRYAERMDTKGRFLPRRSEESTRTSV